MKKQISLLIIVITILFSLSTTALAVPTVSVTLDGNEIQFSDEYGYPFIDENNRTQVPLRAVMEAYGCNVTWDSTNNAVLISKEGETVTVPIGENYILVNGQTVSTDTTAIIRDDRTYLPIRAVLEAFGANVAWDAANNTVVVTSPSTAMQFENIYIDRNGDLVVQLSDGTEKNLGSVKGENGEDGADGRDGLNGKDGRDGLDGRDGKNGQDGVDGKDGADGKDGVSVVDAYIDASGELKIELSNGRIINAGKVQQSETTDILTFDDYAVGTRFYLNKPEGAFGVTVYVDNDPYVVSFDAIYYELTAKYDASDPDAWYYRAPRDQVITYYLPYEVTVYISGETDPALAGKQLYITVSNTKVGYGCFATIENDGTFSTEFAIGNGVDSINTWYAPQSLYLQQVTIQD